jgi:putative AlgH/UPF0301 family transcriptional regulator
VVGERPSRRIWLCLAWLSAGIAVTTATDVQVNATGCVTAALAVLATVLNQVREPFAFTSGGAGWRTGHLQRNII